MESQPELILWMLGIIGSYLGYKTLRWVISVTWKMVKIILIISATIAFVTVIALIKNGLIPT